MTLCTAIAFSTFGPNETPLDERFHVLDRIRRRWKNRTVFRAVYADGGDIGEHEGIGR